MGAEQIWWVVLAQPGMDCSVWELWGSLPVFKRCLRWGLEHLVWVSGQLLVEDTFLSKHPRSAWEA